MESTQTQVDESPPLLMWIADITMIFSAPLAIGRLHFHGQWRLFRDQTERCVSGEPGLN